MIQHENAVRSLREWLWRVTEADEKMPSLFVVPVGLTFAAREAFSEGPEIRWLVLKFNDREQHKEIMSQYNLPYSLWLDVNTFATLSTLQDGEEILRVTSVRT